MNSKSKHAPSAGEGPMGRRNFMGAALGAAAGAGAVAMMSSTAGAADVPPPPHPASPPSSPPMGSPPGESLRMGADGGPKLYREESDIRDVEVEGKIPADLNGSFYRVGPDAQYALRPGNIPFDGEGHVSLFRIENGHVDYKSRFVKNDRYEAQAKARRLLFPMYRNPTQDDPSVAGLSRSTANTHIIPHKNYLLALKEDSPPAAMDLVTLETVDPNYNFDGQLQSQTFTAHPKIDSETGDMIAFGYEAKGFGTKDVNIFQITPQGKMVWNAWIQVPYISLLHDFAVTQKHIVFYVMPLAFDEAQVKRGGVHWSWQSGLPTYFGVMRRGGDGKDLRWFKGPERSSTHVMGAFSDGERVYVDVEMSQYNPFPFMPMQDGSRWDPVKGASQITRLSVDLSKKSVKDYKMEVLYPGFFGALPRIDDRYNTVPYRYGFLPVPDPQPKDRSKRPSACWARFDHQTRKATWFDAGEGTTLNEVVFAPKSPTAPEGVGYLMGVANRNNEGGRGDLIILDAEHPEAGPLATVRLPIRAVPQIHGWWLPKSA
ncbi:MAG: carotenoid oxygenase family protein [Gammaproteobacteria bacterium]